MRRILLPLLGTAYLVQASCGTTSPTTNGELPGRYTGTVQSPVSPSAGSMNVVLGQAGKSVTGTWNTDFEPGHIVNVGTVEGAVQGNSVTMLLVSDSTEACSYIATASFDGVHLSGTYDSVPGCTPGATIVGIFRLVKL